MGLHFQRVRVRNGGDSIATDRHGGQSRELRTYILYLKNKAERAN